MSMCEHHWNKLREAIKERGLEKFIAADASMAMAQTVDQINSGETTKVNYDPLMGSYWAILANGGRMVAGNLGPGVGLYVAFDGPEDPIDLENFPKAKEGDVWPRCVLCYPKKHHELVCINEDCEVPEYPLDWMIEQAADDAVDVARDLGLLDETSS